MLGLKLNHDSEWLDLMAFLGTSDSKVHIVHISCVIISLYIGIIIFPHIDNTNLQATINFKKKDIKNEQYKSEGTH